MSSPARFTGTAPIPASSGEAGGRPIRHRPNRGGNRRLNAAIHRAAMIQLRCEPRARQLRDNALQRGHTRREAMRILKRHLSNILYRRPGALSDLAGKESRFDFARFVDEVAQSSARILRQLLPVL